MLPYIFCFISSCALIWLAENNTKYFITSKIIFLLALIIPAAFAGLRDFSVGVDVWTYGNPFFYDVASSPNLNAVDPMWDRWIEPGYAWLNYIVAQFSDNVRWFYFLLMFLQSIFMFLGFYNYRDKLPIWLGMLLYYCAFLNNSFNYMRQSLAMSIVFFAFCFLLNKSYVKYAIWVLAAFFFHKSAIISLLLIPLHIYAYKFKSDRAKFILITSIAVLALTLETILSVALPVLQMDYLLLGFRYITQEDENSLKSSIKVFGVFLLPFAFFYWKRKKMYSIGEENHFFFIITIICLLSTQIMWIFGPSTIRTTEVFRRLLVLILPMAVIIYKDLPGKQILLKTSIACYAVYYWFFYIVWKNRDGTIPYTSSILSSIF
jgi:hypothetical protein